MTTVKPDWYLVKIDERRHWREDIQAQTKEMYGVYAFDRNRHVHCCELTPSYELHFIANDYVEIEEVADDESKRDALNDLVLSAFNDDPVSYVWASRIEQMMKDHPERFKHVGEMEPEEDEGSKPWDVIAEDWGTGSLMY
jgi:hypothetical protein